MTKTIDFGDLKCRCAVAKSDTVTYLLYPLDEMNDSIGRISAQCGVTVVSVCGMQWDDDLTPWPSAGVPAGSAPFKGHAPAFLERLRREVIPGVEQGLGITPKRRDIVGVSLSGLFAMWQWAICDLFDNMATLSGSFWYDGFVSWLEKNFTRTTPGRIFMLLGDLESKSKVPEFSTVGVCTDEVVRILGEHGMKVHFEMVPGNHYQNALPRLEKAMQWLYMTESSAE